MARYDKDAWKSQAKAAILGNVASQLTTGITGLIKAPFEEPRQRFLLHDQKGQELLRTYKKHTAQGKATAPIRKKVDESGKDSELWHTDMVWDRMLTELKEEHGEEYLKNPYVQAGLGKMRKESQRLGKIESDQFLENERAYAALPDKETFMANVDRYSPRSKSAPQALFRTIKRWVKGQSYEDYVDDAIANITEGMGVDFTDEGVKALRANALAGRKPVDVNGVTAAIETLVSDNNLVFGRDVEREKYDREVAIQANRMHTQDLFMSGQMNPHRASVARDRWSKSDSKQFPTDAEIDADISSNFRDTFIGTDEATNNDMEAFLMGDSFINNAMGQAKNSLARHMQVNLDPALTEDQKDPAYAWYENLDSADQTKVDKKLDEMFRGVYSVGRSMTITGLEIADTNNMIPDRLKNSNTAALLQKEMIRQNVIGIFKGGMETYMAEAITDKNPGWWDSKASMVHLTGALNRRYDTEMLQEIIDDAANGKFAQDNTFTPTMALPGERVVEDASVDEAITLAASGKLGVEDTTVAGAQQVDTTDCDGQPEPDFILPPDIIKLKQDVESDIGRHYTKPYDREQRDIRVSENGLAILGGTNAAMHEKGMFAHHEEQYDAFMGENGHVQGLTKELGVPLVGSTPSSKDRKDPVQFSITDSPFIGATDIAPDYEGDLLLNADEVIFRADDEDEEFIFEVKKGVDGAFSKVTIDFQGTDARKPSGWRISKLTPDNNINIDNIANMNIYNHLRYLAEEYHGASEKDRPHLISQVDFGYGEGEGPDRSGQSILAWEDTALVKDLFNQFNEKYLREDDDDRSPSFLSGATSLLDDKDKDEDLERVTSLLAPYASGVIPL